MEYATSKQLWKIHDIAKQRSRIAIEINESNFTDEIDLLTRVPFPLTKDAASDFIKLMLKEIETLTELLLNYKQLKQVENNNA